MSVLIIYRLLEILASPLIVVYLLLRGFRDPRYLKSLGQRLGFLPRSYRQTGHAAIWLHAVSVGEVLAAAALVRELRARLPEAPLFVSASTLAGKAAAEDKLGALADGVFYAPIDYCLAVRRVLRTIRPRVLVVLETEIWPNLYREAKRAGCGLVIVNGRISDRAMPRYRKLRWFFKPVLDLADAILVQSDLNRTRFLELGAPAEKVQLAGNLKYDFDPRRQEPPAAILEFFERVKPAEVWIAASTMPPAAPGDPDEDDAVIAAFREVAESHPGLLLVLAPRKPERFDRAAEALALAGVAFVRRSQMQGAGAVLLLDSIGELGSLFGLADVVFMGGTLARRGGHNVLEPAFFGKPVIVGPHMENFAEIAAKLAAAGALVPIAGAAELAGAVRGLLEDGPRRERIGAAARAAAESERGATARAVGEIQRVYAASLPRYRAAAPARIALGPLAGLWLAGGAIKRWSGRMRQSRLATPVISVGGLVVGGAGKTPLVLWLAQQLKERGIQSAILTRGYRRRVAQRHTVIAPGERAPAELTGDEAQMYVRAGIGPLGIGADRAGAGRLIEQRFGPQVFLLDDGFQHWPLARSLDIVVLDALDPFGGGAAIPLGRLREPLAALARAGAIVVTRTAPGEDIAAIEARVREYNAKAPVFASRVTVRGWRDVAGEAASLPPRVAAFCGLGNPDSFWRTLRELGVAPLWRRAFPDHHRYSHQDLVRTAAEARAAGAEALLTTEKDVANLGAGWEQAVTPLAVLWLEIGIEVDQAEALMRLVEAPLSRSSRNFLRSSPPP
ncbi:MAG: tetraacyldisaccharide 4'-kinase [Bryobacteraceae bacterium]